LPIKSSLRRRRTPDKVSSPSNPLVELQHCSIVFDEHCALDDVSFRLCSGERWVLLGPNGSGKTLLLKLIRADMWPTPLGPERRTYRVGYKAQSDAQDVKREIAYIGPERQDKYVRYEWNLRVREVVTTGLFDEDIPLTRPTASQVQRMERLMRQFKLWSLRDRRFLTLSYGQRRLVLIARAMAANPQVLLMDEVFNGLDTRTRRKLIDVLARRGRSDTWVLTSHRDLELPSNFTHWARIEKGQIVARGEKHDLVVPLKSNATRSAAALHAFRFGSKTKSKRERPFIRIAHADIYREYRPVIRDLNWELNYGEHWAILGANGSGKSTLMSVLYGDLHVALGGELARDGFKRGVRIEEWKRRVGWVSPELQADHYAARTIEEIVISGRYSSVGLDWPPTSADRNGARKWLKFFGLEALAQRGPRQVSYGQLRLALIARAMVNSPELLLLDEPCAGLDREVRAEVLQLLDRLAHSGVQIVMAVHDHEDIIPSIGHVLRIEGGRAVQENRDGISHRVHRVHRAKE
jgi:molybdate transport system ATP-binding protein